MPNPGNPFDRQQYMANMGIRQRPLWISTNPSNKQGTQ